MEISNVNSNPFVTSAKVEEEDEDESSSEEEYNPHGPSKYFILKDGVAPVDESELDEWADDEAF